MNARTGGKKVCGVFEKVGGWRLVDPMLDTDGRRRREEIGPERRAIELAEKRRSAQGLVSNFLRISAQGFGCPCALAQ
jgi:hypothetical protein